MKLISLKSDYAFKELFSHENIRKQFLSDVLKIPLEEIRSAILMNTHLWMRYRKHKQGILDVLMELADGTKVNVEMQVKCRQHWVKRQLFYLAKIYTGDLKLGEDYARLHRCVSIGILDYNLTQAPQYHRFYRMRDETGEELSGVWEIHVIELRKKLQETEETEAIDDWIRLFNAENEEDLDMIKSKSLGIMEAIEIVKELSMTKSLRYWYETELQLRRDRKAEDDYVREEGRAEGREEGRAEGREEGKAEGRIEGRAEGKAEDIVELLEDVGAVSEELRKKIFSQKDMEVLRKWHKLAVRVRSIDEFEQQVEEMVNV